MPATHLRPLTLALGGGGAKCAAQAGVLAVLEEAGLPIGPLVGVSGGGVVAVLYAAGFAPWQIRDEFAAIQLLEVWEPDPGRRAVFGPARIQARFRTLVGDKTFADLKRRVVVMAMDLHTARPVQLEAGPLAEAMLATMSIPTLFPGVERDGQRLVDCGVIGPLPLAPARALGPRCVAVDVLHHNSPEEADHIFEARGPMRYAGELVRRLGMNELLGLGYQTLKIAMNELTEWAVRAYPPDLLLRPEVGRVGLFAFDQAEFAYTMGEAAARAALPQLLALAEAAPPSPWLRLRGRLKRLRRGLTDSPRPF